jgi:hypothetical protein
MGYTDSLFYFPTDAVIRQQWYDILCWGPNSSSKKKRIDSNPRKYCLAWWHFSPDHLEKHGSRYTIKRQGSYIDSAGQEWSTPNHPPPNYPIWNHIEEQDKLASLMFHSLHSFPWWTAMQEVVPSRVAELEKQNRELSCDNDVLKKQLSKTVASEMELNKKLTKQVHMIEAQQKVINVMEAKAQLLNNQDKKSLMSPEQT